jgi:hypothetical protein
MDTSEFDDGRSQCLVVSRLKNDNNIDDIDEKMMMVCQD